MERVDLDDVADTIGVDPSSAREWAENLGGWLRGQAENLGEEVANRATPACPEPRVQRTPSAAPKPTGTDPLSSAQPNPLDVPSHEQGLALTALDSGRWTVEAGNVASPPRVRVRARRTRSDWSGSSGSATGSRPTARSHSLVGTRFSAGLTAPTHSRP